MRDTPSNDGVAYIELNAYVSAYESAKAEFDKGYLDKLNTVHITDLFDNFFNDYYKEHTQTLVLSYEEKAIYRYNPKALSYKIYQTPNMWEVILKMNEYSHPGEMDLETPIIVPSIEAMEDFFGRISNFKDGLGGYFIDIKDAF